VSKWLSASAVPTLIVFSEDYIEPIFGERKAAIFLFRANDQDQSAMQKAFEEAAIAYKGEILFVVSDCREGIQKRLGEFIGVEFEHMPTIRVLDPAQDMKKFTYSGNVNELTKEAIKQFVDDFKANKLVPFLKSQDIPEQNEPVKILVGKNFNDIVMDDTKDVFVKFYAPWCGHCKKLAPIWDEIAKELEEVHDLVIAKFDATANEVEGLEIKGYPTLKFYPAGGKKTPIDHDGDREKEPLIKWLSEKSGAYKKYLEAKKIDL